MSFIKTMFGLVLFAVACGAVVSIVIFAVDVIRWHDKEEKVTVTPSAEPDPNKDYTESEVSNLGDDAGKYNSSAVSDSWL